MKKLMYILLPVLLAGCAPKVATPVFTDPLPSWNDRDVKFAITDFVSRVTDSLHADFIPPIERIAVFDNDGTLWCEHPLYTEMLFSMNLAGNRAGTPAEFGKNPLQVIEKAFVLSHSGMSTDAFAQSVQTWLDTARHARFQQPYTALAYQPMLELLSYLQQNGFKTYIVSGGSASFMRLFAAWLYGVPPERVIGTTFKEAFADSAGIPRITYLPDILFVNDGPAKPVAIEQRIGKKPVLAFGNSDGDLQMLQWTASNPLGSLCLILHHTDAEREYAYDSLTSIGTLKQALIEGQQKGWQIVDMKEDFKTVFAFQEK